MRVVLRANFIRHVRFGNLSVSIAQSANQFHEAPAPAVLIFAQISALSERYVNKFDLFETRRSLAPLLTPDRPFPPPIDGELRHAAALRNLVDVSR